MIEQELSPYQLLFFNRELNFGSSSSNILKGNVKISGANYSQLKLAIIEVLTNSEWAYLSINPKSKSWQINEKWNGDFVEQFIEPELALGANLWSVQLVQETEKDSLLRLCLHHCLGDAHSFNLFWNNVYSHYEKGTFIEPSSLQERTSESNSFVHSVEQKELPADLGLGEVKRLSFDFNTRVFKHLSSFAAKTSGSIMTFLLEQIEEELADTEKHLEIPLQLGIALRNRKSKGQKNAFPTNVNFLPLIKGINQTMQQRLRYVFRHQDYPLLNFLAANDQRIAFNALFSYQKETYHFSDEFALHFHFEPCVADDNIIGIHLLEYGDNRLTLHLDYRKDIASEYYWRTFIRSLIRKITARVISRSNIKSVIRAAKLEPRFNGELNFWHWFENANPAKLAIISKDAKVTFGDLARKAKEFTFDENQKIIQLNTERTIENISNLIAAWRSGKAVSYHDVPNDLFKENTANFAYAAKTSGTSGSSKTILISFDALKSLIPDWKEVYKTKDSVHLSLADQRFDVFFGDLLRSVFSGETLVLASDDERLDAAKINQLIQQHHVTHIESTPSFLSYLLPELKEHRSLTTIICGSEPIFDSFFRLTQRKEFEKIQFFNSYGLTECSIDSSVASLNRNPDGKFPSGFVIGNQTISIQDKRGAIKPKGVWGEIHIDGACVGINPAIKNHNRSYATGDLGMITPEDGLIVGGRINDDFIKVNGRRIPAAHIEDFVSQLTETNACLCLEVDKTAVLFIYGHLTIEKVQQKLSATFSKYQLPDAYFFCEDWPINRNGKADRERLIEWYRKTFQSKQPWIPSEKEPEQIIFDCLKSRGKAFGSTEDSLISFGWNSIELLSLANELNRKGIFVPHTAFIQQPTIGFILATKELTLENSITENPDDKYVDLDDILSVLNE